MDHSPLGPSSAERWLNCPGSVNATKDLPDIATAYSVEGTAAHTLTEWCRKRNVRADEYLNETITVIRDDRYGVVVTQEMVDAVNSFVDYCNDLEGETLVEEKVTYHDFVPKGFGTLDHAAMRPGELDIIDFKYGQGVQVYAKDNPQLMLYALGVAAEWDWLYGFIKVTTHIHQPRLDHVDTSEFDYSELYAWGRGVVVPGAKATLRKNAPFKAGSWCQFCKIKATCRTRAESVFNTVVGDFENLDEAVEKTAKTPILTNDEIAVALSALPNIKRWWTDLESHAMRELSQGHGVGEYKIVEGRSRREWGLKESEIALAWNIAGLDTHLLWEKKLLTPPAAEKLIGKKHEVWKTTGIINKPPGKPTLAPGSDPRPALKVDASTEFTNLDTEES